ncbi:MAG: amino acid ABC transporter permease [Methanomassiliicoccales archaeon]|nr:amino acid ABC transporter permease [Methanomassiliicoccales archaeon]MDD1756993.1 amino acid ABC transporter permease [Methanomassiliicoccales archaeon]
MQLDWSVIPEYIWFLLAGAVLTVLIAAISIALGFAGGILVGMGRISNNFLVHGVTTCYVEAFRGTPLLIQIFLIFFGLPSLGIYFDPIPAGILALSLNSAAYQAEIFRGGVQSISKGQMEASRAMGLSYNQTLLNVIIPQGLRNALPAYTNEFITLIKDSSLVSIIGVMELTLRGKIVIGLTFQPFVVYIFIAILYFIMTYVTSRVLRQIETKKAIPGMIGVE